MWREGPQPVSISKDIEGRKLKSLIRSQFLEGETGSLNGPQFGGKDFVLVDEKLRWYMSLFNSPQELVLLESGVLEL
jgi:hypothetical protein